MYETKMNFFTIIEKSQTFTDCQPEIESFHPQKSQLLPKILAFSVQEGPTVQYPLTKTKVKWNGILELKIPVTDTITKES